MAITAVLAKNGNDVMSEIDLGRGPERMKILRARPVPGMGAPGEIIDDALVVACGSGAIQIVEAQRAGKTVLSGEELARGAQIRRGARFI